MVTVPPAATVDGDTLKDRMLGGVVSFPPVGGGVGAGALPIGNEPSAVGGAGAEIVSWVPAAARAPVRLTVQVPEAAAKGMARVSCQIPSCGVPETRVKGPQVTGAGWPLGS